MAPEVTAGGLKEDANPDQVNGETDTSGVGETNKSGASSKDEQSSPVSEHRDSKTTQHDQDPNLSPSETHTSEDNQQEINKPVPASEKESGNEGNSEEPDLYSASSHQPQNSTPTKPDNRTNDTFQESPDAAHEEAGQQGEVKTTKESDECIESEDDTGENKKMCPEWPKRKTAKSNRALVSIMNKDKRMMKLLYCQTEKRNFKRNKVNILFLWAFKPL